MARELDLYKIGSTPEELQAALIQMRQDFDSHIHDGSNSRSFETLQANTLSAQTILIRKTSYGDTASGIWMGIVQNVMKLKLGSTSSYLQWDGSALTIVGSITATSGTIGGWTIGSSTLTGGGVTLDSAGVITGGTIRTSSGSDRVEMSSASNDIRIYKSNVLRAYLYQDAIFFLNSSGNAVGSISTNSTYAVAIAAQNQTNGSIFLFADDTGQISMSDGSRLLFYADFNLGINVSRSIYPSADVTYDIGSSAISWKDSWFDGVQYYRQIAQPVVYHGYCSGTSITNQNGSFTLANPSTGKYTITHNFGTTAYNAQATVLRGSGAGAYTAKIEAKNSDTLQVTVFDDTGTVRDSDFMFLITKV